MSLLQIYLFGYPRVVRDQVPLRLERRRTMALLAYLAVTGPSPRASLVAMFWPDHEPNQANAYLRHSLWEITKIIGEEWIEKEGAIVGLRTENGIWCDATEFAELISFPIHENPSAYMQAVTLQDEDFLKGFTLKDSFEFDDWQAARTEGYRIKLAEILASLCAFEAENGRLDQSINLARRRLALDPLDESSHRLLMQLLSQAGQRSAALRQYEICQNILHEQLRVSPENETIRLYKQIQTEESNQPAQPARPTPFTRPPIPVFLPMQPTAFIGRQAEQEQICATLNAPDCRLLMLTGPGGIGKTRLAIQAAGRYAASLHTSIFSDGIFFCSFSGISDLRQVPDLLADSLRLQQPGPKTASFQQAMDQVTTFLAEKAILLVIDNMDLLAEHSAFLLDLLASGPNVKLLVTSRERLNLTGEWVIELEGLPIPTETTPDIANNPAIELFIKGAQRNGRFIAGAQDWPAVLQICRLVDGIPLGIELASAWVRMFSCAEIAAEIQKDLTFLDTIAGGNLGLRAAFEQSWRLLPSPLQDIFCRLSVFQSGFDRNAAQHVAGASLHHLAALSDRSLIRRISSGRYDLHEILKQFTAQKLAAAPDIEAQTHDRHYQYFLNWICQRGEDLKGPQQFNAVSAFRAESQNIRAAWERAINRRDFKNLSLAAPLFILFHEMHGKKHEGLRATELLLTALKQNGAREDFPGLYALLLTARRLFGLGVMELSPGDLGQSESLRLASQLPEGSEKAYILLLNSYGPAAPPALESVDLCKQSRAIFDRIAEPWGSALATLMAADSTLFGGLGVDLARELYLQSLAEFQALNNAWGVMLSKNGLAYIAIRKNSLAEAASLFQESIRVFSSFDNAAIAANLRFTLGNLLYRMEQPTQALEVFRINRDYYLQTGQKQDAERYSSYISQIENGNYIARF